MAMPKLSQRTISALQRVITGDRLDARTPAVAPYQSGPRLVRFFNEHGCNDVYPAGGGFPSRWQYVEDRLTAINETAQLIEVIEAAVYPSRFLDTEFAVEEAVTYLNRYLRHDKLELVSSAGVYRLRRTGERLVELESKLAVPLASHQFIEEQLTKCDRKLQDVDYDGAITNARSLIEALLSEIEAKLDLSPPQYDGDLPRLYRRVQKLLNLEPSRPDISDSLRQVLGGLASIIAGLAPLRNKMGDAHVRSYKPERHHAKLAVNAAKTVADFLIDSFEYQKATGKVAELNPSKQGYPDA